VLFSENETLYDLLEVNATANNDEIVSAYLKAKSVFNKGGSANYSLLSDEERQLNLEKIEAAFLILRDSAKRIEYNQRIGLSTEIKNEPIIASNLISNKFKSTKNSEEPPSQKSEIKSEIKNKAKINPILLEINNEQNWTGKLIKKIRTQKKISLEDLSNYTKISKKYLTAIEEETYEQLPARVYLRGFLIQICKRLELPEQKVVDTYLSKMIQKTP